MSRIFSRDDNGEEQPRIEYSDTIEFFENRAKKAERLGYDQAVIYQDKHPEIARKRDLDEKALLLPKLELNKKARVLDIGCGTGRWAKVIAPAVARYHGIDASAGLIDIAQKRFADYPTAQFSELSVHHLSLADLVEHALFERVLCAGVLLYLNDPDVYTSLQNIADIMPRGGIFILREPVGIERRLTIRNHFSEEMEQTYNAIYRTESELKNMFMETLYIANLALADYGDVYGDSSLNNRKETKQRWYLFRKN